MNKQNPDILETLKGEEKEAAIDQSQMELVTKLLAILREEKDTTLATTCSMLVAACYLREQEMGPEDALVALKLSVVLTGRWIREGRIQVREKGPMKFWILCKGNRIGYFNSKEEAEGWAKEHIKVSKWEIVEEELS